MCIHNGQFDKSSLLVEIGEFLRTDKRPNPEVHALCTV